MFLHLWNYLEFISGLSDQTSTASIQHDVPRVVECLCSTVSFFSRSKNHAQSLCLEFIRRCFFGNEHFFTYRLCRLGRIGHALDQMGSKARLKSRGGRECNLSFG